MTLPTFPFDLSRYPRIWECPQASLDPRHIAWLFDVLSSGYFQNALEIGCLNGASSTAFVEAINQERLAHATFCDLDIRETLNAVLSHCRFPERTATFTGRSIDLLDRQSGFDFVFVDGDHRWATVQAETERLLQRRPVCVMAHDSGADMAGMADCEGVPYLKWRFQTTAPYLCLEDNALRPGELTHRGLFLATTSPEVFEVARTSLLQWGEPHVAVSSSDR